jgi:hypothetical protein
MVLKLVAVFDHTMEIEAGHPTYSYTATINYDLRNL